MNIRSMEIIEDAISQGSWNCLEIANDANSIYLEFNKLKLSAKKIHKKNSNDLNNSQNKNSKNNLNNSIFKVINLISKDNNDSNLISKDFSEFVDYSDNFAIRFGDNTFLAIFYNDFKSIDFLNLNENKLDELINHNKKIIDLFQSFYTEFSLDLLPSSFKFQDFDYLKKIANYFDYKNILVENYSKSNQSYDFLLCFQTEEIAIAIGADNINLFNGSQSLNDDDIKSFSNNWTLYYLNYWNKKESSEEYEYDELCEYIPLK